MQQLLRWWLPPCQCIPLPTPSPLPQRTLMPLHREVVLEVEISREFVPLLNSYRSIGQRAQVRACVCVRVCMCVLRTATCVWWWRLWSYFTALLHCSESMATL